MTYDADGNLLTRYGHDPSLQLTWNALSQLTTAQVTQDGVGTSVTYDYDGCGRRISKTVGGVRTTTHYVLLRGR